jgi:hypothetical protein
MTTGGDAVALLVCVFCGEPITSVRTSFRKVTGWERHRDAGGTNALALREPTDEWACWACVDRQRHGVAPMQQVIG